ncbi:serine hydrolase domain-containing protein [Paraflavitalea pollutisoli]|uniref:serine hydrolase domain-containing protein n=1 Tax=Paraflavitalea pollutisoli TaxID=3034143 RepID=UPI0023EDEDCF|nr:serine hydrolase domain-containing protein [Paraflavitalea sp. H1-2-19X]
MPPIIRLLLIIVLLTYSANLTTAQSLPDSTRDKIDRLFAQWDRQPIPGCVAGVVMGDQLVYAKGFGLAQLEQRLASTPESIYYMCSVSKQFAGYAVAYLVNEGKIRLEEDIHTYVPSLQDLGSKVTVENLLHHTSGLRDDIRLMDLFGLGGSGLLTQELGMRIIRQQHSLNFEPGTKYAYSNSNYVLLAEIVAHVSGTSFRRFTDSVIFKPLQMTNSFFADDPYALMPGLAPSYSFSNGQWRNARQQVYTLGDGGLFTSLQDMSKWVRHYWSPDGATQQVMQLFTATQPLKDGRRNYYAMGISVDTVNGRRRLLHNGSLAGYRTVVLAYPDQQLGFVVFGNGSDNAVYNKVMEMSDLLLPPVANQGGNVRTESPTTGTALPDSNKVRKLAGAYIAANGYRVDVSWQRGALYVGSNELAPASFTEFYIRNRPAVRYRFAGETLQLISPAMALPIELQSAGAAPTGAALKNYVGRYHSDELDCRFTISLQEGKLVIEHIRLGKADMVLVGPDHGVTQAAFIRHLLFTRDHRGRITGFDYNDGDIMHLHFSKER